MQGKKVNSPKLLYTINLNDLVPLEHPIRKIAEVLDLSFLYDETKKYYSHEGKPSIDPVVLMKLYIIGYFFGITSERRLLQEIQVNLAYRWYLGYDFDEDIPHQGKKLLKARQIIVEGVIGECKNYHLLSKSRYRGLIKFKSQLYMTAFVINLKRMINNINKMRLANKNVGVLIELIRSVLSAFQADTELFLEKIFPKRVNCKKLTAFGNSP